MNNLFNVKPIINKKNHQINVSISRKQLKKLIAEPDKVKFLKLRLEGFK